jgi:CheY-like chemotaxis protein
VTTLLIVDDEQPVRDLLTLLFEDIGYRTLEAPHGKAALRIVEAERPDLVLTDVMMPIMDGVELCERLKTDPATASIPVLLMSAAGRLANTAHHADATIAKPFNLDKLEQLVQRWLSPAGPDDASS